MLSKYFATFLTFLIPQLLFSLLSEAEPLVCRNLFLDVFTSKKLNIANSTEFNLKPVKELYSGNFKPNLNTFHFDANQNKLFYYAENQWIELGRFETIKTDYLYQWSEESFHERLMSHGVNKQHMTQILEFPGQASGKGFYISLNPVDSSSFGDRMTLFRQNRSVLVLKFNPILRDRFKTDTKLISSLVKIGIDAIQTDDLTYNQNWYAILNYKILQDPQLPNPNALYRLLTQKPLNRNINAQNLLGLISLYSEPNKNELIQMYLRVMAGDSSLSMAEIKKFDEDTNSNFKNELLKIVYNKTVESKDLPEFQTMMIHLTQIFPYLNSSDYQYKLLHEYFYQSAFRTRQVTEYSNILKYFDAKDLAFGSEKSGSTWPEIFSRVKSTVSKIETKLKPVKRKKIKSFDDFVKTFESIFDIKAQFRDSPIYMSERDESYELEVTVNVLSVLNKNPFLNITILENLNYPIYKVKVEYGDLLNTLRGYLNFLRFYHVDVLNPNDVLMQSLSDDYNQVVSLSMKLKNGDITKDDIKLKRLSKAIHYKIMKHVFNLVQNKSFDFEKNEGLKLAIYNMIISVHPLADGNGRFSRLFLNLILNEDYNLALFDFDSFINVSREVKIESLVMRNWIANAKDDEEFTERTKIVYDQLQSRFKN